jgi:hypothetical protein
MWCVPRIVEVLWKCDDCGIEDKERKEERKRCEAGCKGPKGNLTRSIVITCVVLLLVRFLRLCSSRFL